MWDVLGLGCATVDDLFYVPSYPEPDTKMRITRSERRVGGLTAVALAAAARLGSRCAYAGMLGHDDISRFVEAELRREGIDTSTVVYRDDAQPVYAVIIADTTSSTRTIFFEVRGRTGADDEQPSPEVIRSAGVLFIDDYNPVGNIRAATIAREAGIPIVADLEHSNAPKFEEILGLVDHLILSSGFAMQISGTNHPADAARNLWTDDRALVVVTCGEEGCWYVSDPQHGPKHQAAFPVEAVDTTGCGDVFHGAYASALRRGLPVSERIAFASAAAALKASKAGGIQAIPTRQQVEAFLSASGPASIG
jgi:sulfofructose kinase